MNVTSISNRLCIKHSAVAASVIVACMVPSVQASPIAGQGTWESTLQPRYLASTQANSPDAYYDTDLNITWLTDANAASAYSSELGYGGGGMPEGPVSDWLNGLSIGNVTGWRLPKISGVPDCPEWGYDCGFVADITKSEMPHLFFATLGNKAAVYDSHGLIPGTGLTNTGPFQNIQMGLYWSSTDASPVASIYWSMGGGGGVTGLTSRWGGRFQSWAVHDGDIGLTSPVPEADSMVLALTGLLVGWVSRRKKASGNSEGS